MTEDLPAGTVSPEAIRRHLVEAGKYALIAAVLMAGQTGIEFLIETFDLGGYLRIGLVVVSIILFIAALLNALGVINALEKAGQTAWRMDQLRNVLAVALIATAALFGGLAYDHYTTASAPFADELDAAQDDRQAALEAAAAAEDTDVVEKHVEEAEAAQSDIRQYELYGKFWRFAPAGFALAGAAFCLLWGFNGLLTSPRPEVNNADV